MAQPPDRIAMHIDEINALTLSASPLYLADIIVAETREHAQETVLKIEALLLDENV